MIDVGINRVDDASSPKGYKLVGDVAFDEVQHARAVTPVPGGVGPMTISCLLANTVQAAAEQLRGGAHADSKIDWDQLPDRSMIGGTAEA